MAGGLAVNAHGYLRFTRDVDLVVQLVPENIVAAFGALETIGYRPLVPVTAADFADPGKLRGVDSGQRDDRAELLVRRSPRHTRRCVRDGAPFGFEEEYDRALVKPLGSVAVRFVSIPSLTRMKEAAGRAEDTIDIEYLRKLADAGN